MKWPALDYSLNSVTRDDLGNLFLVTSTNSAESWVESIYEQASKLSIPRHSITIAKSALEGDYVILHIRFKPSHSSNLIDHWIRSGEITSINDIKYVPTNFRIPGDSGWDKGTS